MAIRALLLRKNLNAAKEQMAQLDAAAADIQRREAELEADIADANTDEERAAVEEAVTAIENDTAANETARQELQRTIDGIETELAQIEASAPKKPTEEPAKERKEVKFMSRTRFCEMTNEQRSIFVAQENVHQFLERVRNLGAQNRSVSGAELLIPTEVMPLLRREVERESKLMKYVRVVHVSGHARQPVQGSIPEAVWTEACGAINELQIGFAALEMDGYKVASYAAICNSALKDADPELLDAVLFAIGASIGKGVDKAIIFGTGIHMPTGIATRLAQTSQPADWPSGAPAWEDLHTSNILSLNIGAETGVAFFSALLGALGVAKPTYSTDGLFWVMNRKTHMAIMAKALAFNSAGAVVAGMSNQMPVIGGEIVEMEADELADNDIIGGFGFNYVLAEREGTTISQSEHVLFIQDHTVVKGVARYDGEPADGAAFVAVNFNNGTATTARTFAYDYANNGLNALGLVAANGTASGDTVVTVSNMLDSSNNTLKYKAKASANDIVAGQIVTGYTALTSGTTQITAAAGIPIAVVELDGDGRVVSAGTVVSVPKT